MIGIVSRTCTEILPGDENRNRERPSRPLEDFRSEPAYVLLGDPGAGKTTAFESECRAHGEDACFVTARDFIALDLNIHSEWREKTLFVDGLDEVRAGSSDARTPFDEIRRRLDALGRPRFRLSCRTADWLGGNDRRHLKSVSPEAGVTVLQLDPLSETEVVEILTARQDIVDPGEFIQNAREQRVYGLLANPLTLKMLADAVGGGRHWPDSRRETFEMACRRMVQEHNDEHQAASEPEGPPPPDQLLDAAGRLCAIHLLSGAAGCSLRSNEASDDFPALDRFDHDSPELLRRAVATKLFKGASEDRFVPVHRHIAEFLGARHLAHVIEAGLPTRRVLALIAGEDGFVVTEMRGLSAWLAAHCSESRVDLIDRDPFGIGQYGDVGEFSIHEKRTLLRALHREASRLGTPRIAVGFGGIASPDMASALRQVLIDSSRSREHQLFTAFVLRVLVNGKPLAFLSEILQRIVRDESWSPGINCLALDAFIRCQETQKSTSELKVLLDDIWNGRVSDPDYELTGTILESLYPRYVPPSEVLDYVLVEGNLDLFGRYWRFWEIGLLDASTDEILAEVLDNLCHRLPRLQPALERLWLRYLPAKLLIRGLEAYGDELGTERLYDWLGVPTSARSPELVRIRSWIEQRPEVQKKIILEGLDRYRGTGEVERYAYGVKMRLLGVLPADFGRWCLEQSVAMVKSKPEVAGYLFEEAIYSHRHQQNDADLSLELLKHHSDLNDLFRTKLDLYISSASTPPEKPHRLDKYVEQRRMQKEEWLDCIRSNQSALLENQATPALLHRMAKVYFGGYFQPNIEWGPLAIEKSVHGDERLRDIVLQGLQSSVFRSDIPAVDEVLELFRQSRMSFLHLPFLAGLAELDRTTRQDPAQWSESRIRKAIVFYYSAPHGNYRPEWYRRLLRTRPELVAGIQVKFAVSAFRSGRESVYKLWELAHDQEYVDVAHHAVLPLLKAFPTRCKLKQLRDLRHLLWASLQYADRDSLRKQIEKKLSRTSMNPPQRVHWLAVGVVVAPYTCKDPLSDFVQGKEGRSRHLAAFFSSDDPLPISLGELEISIVGLLIRLVGRWIGPNDWADANGTVTAAKNSTDLVNKLIRNLAASSDKAAGDILEALCSDPDLSRWRYVLSDARDTQRVIWRDARYRHPGIEQVCRTLNGGSPANTADLSALVLDRLDEIGKQIRTGNTDDWRQYWNEDPHGRRCTPKHENSCRDAMLSDLRQRLPQGVAAEPEGHYARDRRADIRVSFQDFQVPVEIKKNGHQDLWRACRTQLIEQYTRDPATDGFGIYLVFWFGPQFTQRSPSGHRPADAQKLRKHLQETLSDDERRKISIEVIDVSGGP